MTDNNDTTAPEMIDGAHIGTADEQTNDPAGLSNTTATTAITGQTAGVDEPEPSLRDDEELDQMAGDAPRKGQTSDASPQGSTGEDGRPDELDWLLPDDSDEDGGRSGLLSTRSEVLGFAVGITAGGHLGLSGDAQLINDVVGLSILGDRARRANKLPQKHIEQAKEELPHFVAGVVVGYAATKTDIIGEMYSFGGW